MANDAKDATPALVEEVAEASAEGEDGAAAPPPNPEFVIPIHTLIETARSAHGLRHDDHGQYRRYCSRRLSRLRRSKAVRKELSHGAAGGRSGGGDGGGGGGKGGKGAKGGSTPQHKKGGRHSYHPRPATPADSTHHVNFALVSLYSAERAWSSAMEIKAKYDEAKEAARRGKKKGDDGGSSGNAAPGKIRRLYLRKLKKATGYATELEGRSRASCDDRTAVEARAYAGWMRGNWSLEMGDWQTACTEYGSALTICRALGSGDAAAAADGGGENGQSGSDGGASGGQDDLELRDFFTARAEHVIEPLLRFCQYELQEGGMLQSDMLSLMKAQEESETKLLAASFPQQSQLKSKLDSLRGEKRLNEASGGSMATVNFRSHDVAVENKDLRVALLKIADLKSDLEKAGGGGDETKFLALLSGYDDAISIVSDDLKEYMGMKSGPAVNAKRFEAESLLGYAKNEKLKLLMTRNEGMVDELRVGAAGSAGGEDAKRLEQIAHLYDALLQDAKSVAELPGGDAADTEDEFVLEANANVLRLRALRCYYVAQMYGIDSVGKYAEAAALFEQSKLLASRAAEEIAACQDMDDALIQSMEDLERDIVGAKSRALASAYLARSGSGGGQSSSSGNLLRRLDDFEAGSSMRQFVEVPPALEPIACKPTFFDIAMNHVGELPLDDLQKHVDAHKEQSTGLLGWFRRG